MDQGGVERGVVEVNRALVKAGFDNTVVAVRGRLVDRVLVDGGHFIELDVKSKNPLTFFSRARRLRRVLQEARPDVVVAHSRVPAWLFRWANRGLGIPWITFAHGLNSVSAYSKVMTSGDLVVTPSRCVADYLRTSYGTPEEKIRVIPRAVDTAKFDPGRLDAAFVEQMRQAWGTEGMFVVMGVGRITQLKGYDTLIRATGLAAKEIPNIRTVIVGEAEEIRKDYFEELKKLVADLGLADRVVFAGPQTKVAECLSLANVVVSSNTRKPEAFGRSMAEALAMNRPVVATRFGGALDIVKDGVNGKFVDVVPDGPDASAKRAAEFAAAIVAVSKMTFGDLRAPILEKFSFDRMIELSIKTYRELENGTK